MLNEEELVLLAKDYNNSVIYTESSKNKEGKQYQWSAYGVVVEASAELKSGLTNKGIQIREWVESI